MDTAKEEPFRSAKEMQGVMLGRHEEELSTARHAVESLAAQVTDLSLRLLMLYQEPSSDHRRHPSPDPRVNNPLCYASEPTECRAFLTQCEVVFSFQPQTYAGDPARIAFVLSLLTGRAREWGTFAWGDSLLWPLRALQGGDDQDLRSFCFRLRGFAPSHNASSGQKVCR